MIIGIDASRANRAHKSGTEWYSYYLICALAELDTKNHYILYSDTPLADGLAEVVRQKNFRAKILGWPWKFFWTQGRLALEMLFYPPDILFVPAHALPIIHPRRSVVTLHDIGFRREGNLYERSQIGAESSRRQKVINFLVKLFSLGRYEATSFDYFEWSTQFSLAHAKAIIAISEFTKKELEEVYGAKSEKIRVIYNGYNDRLYHRIESGAKGTSVLASYGLTEPYIFYVGRLEKKKNTAVLVEAFYLLKQRWPELSHKLYLIGDASFGFDDIKYSIHNFGLDHDVIATGWVAEEDLPYIFSRASAFVFPSNYEGFGIPLLQAMATGTPIAASNVASIPEIAGKAALLFDPTKPEEIAEALYKTLTDEKLREKLRQAGFERVKDFNWDRCAKETLDVLESV